MTIKTFAHVSDSELLDQVARAVVDERCAVAELIALLAEVDARRLFLPEGCSSLFTYCTQVLHFSEQEAYLRIAAARAAREFPVILDRLRDGSLSLTAVAKLKSQLTPDNADELITAARHKTKREIDIQIAALAPKPDVKPMVRRLPDHGTTEKPPVATTRESELITPPDHAEIAVPLPSPRPICQPLSADRYLLRVTLSDGAHANLRRAQDLMKHSVPNCDPAAVIDRALTLLVADLERRRLANVENPRPPKAASESDGVNSRYIPAAVRREVWMRDGGRCAFVGRQGRCREAGRLEFHHVEPFALGGATTAANLQLRCRAHNQYESALLFGDVDVAMSASARPSASAGLG